MTDTRSEFEKSVSGTSLIFYANIERDCFGLYKDRGTENLYQTWLLGHKAGMEEAAVIAEKSTYRQRLIYEAMNNAKEIAECEISKVIREANK